MTHPPGTLRFLLVFAALSLPALRSWAENEGLPDLDRAIEQKILARSMQDLEEVIRSCQTALRNGLDPENSQFAKLLLTSSLYERAERLCGPILDQPRADRRWPLLRQVALKDLERVIELMPDLAQAHMLIARLHALPGGDAQRAIKAASAAVLLFDSSKKEQAEALVLRATLRDQPERQLEDYDRAIRLDPGNADAWRGRAMVFLAKGEFEKAIADFRVLLEKKGDDVKAHLALGEALMDLEKVDEAAKHVERAIQLDPSSSLAYTLRARLHLIKEDAKAALGDLDQALRVQPRNISALMLRARVHLSQKHFQAAKDDIQRLLILSPGLSQAILLRSMVFAEEGRLSDAIADLQALLRNDAKNVALRMQLAGYYIEDRRPSKAIELFSEILAEDKDNVLARQARADTLLSVGRHAEAIADFEILVQQKSESDGVLNNFAWVLATSPEDALRDGQRAVKLATQACELTHYKKAHILSTLAAAYAETGDFETAIRWSKKAVALGSDDKEVEQQLRKELESYKRKKPWRERQTVDEKEEPLQQRRSRFAA